MWILAFLSPTIAELCSGSSPPLEFFFPPFLIGLLGMYGAGVLVVRELSARWNLGWAGVLMLGIAYGVLEEGIAVKSFLDPGWSDLGDLGEYGRWWGINWVWAVWLCIYHATISICVPILIFNMLWPQYSGKVLLTRTQFSWVVAALSADIAIFALMFSVEYVPPSAQYLLMFAAFFGFVWMARLMPRTLVSARHQTTTWSPWKFFGLGLVMMFGSFLIASGTFTREFHPIGTIMLLLLVSAFTLLMLQHRMGSSENRIPKAYFVGGLLSFLVVIGVLVELGGSTGMSVVAFVTALFVVDLTRWSRGKKVLVFRVGRFLYGDR